jgi:beta-phosphoglucomutase
VRFGAELLLEDDRQTPELTGTACTTLHQSDECQAQRIVSVRRPGTAVTKAAINDPMTQAIRAVLFDLDGTLVDNMNAHIGAWIEMGRKLGRELTREEILRDFSGRKNEELLPKVAGRPLEPAELEELAEEKEARYRELYAPDLRLLAGAEALLDELAAHGVAAGIASAAPRKNREFVLNGLGLMSRMGTVVGAEEVEHGKPAPDLFLEAAKRLRCEPQAALVFEDAMLGVQAGRAAGMTVCGVTTSEPAAVLQAAGAHFTIADFTQLPEPLRARLWRGSHRT